MLGDGKNISLLEWSSFLDEKVRNLSERVGYVLLRDKINTPMACVHVEIILVIRSRVWKSQIQC